MRYRSALFSVLIAAGSLSATGAALADADGNCTCRGNGEDIVEGQTVCLRTASGMKLARCERVLNNTSWKILQSECPTAQLPQQSAWVAAQG